MKKHILALDQGTTSSRAILFNYDMSIVQIAQKEFTQIFPQPGWVEHDPNEIFDTQLKVALQCMTEAEVQASDIVAAGITNQRETTIVWDKNTGMPVYNAIVWQDRRTAEYCDSLKEEGKADIIQKKTGLLLDAYFSGTKIKWILDNVEGARAKAEKGDLLFGTVDTWLIWNFSKSQEHLTDPSNASRTLLFNIHTLDWDDELLSIFNIPRTMLPKVVPSSGESSQIHPEFFGRAIPIAGIAGDQQAATFGNACLEPGMIKNTYGTGCFMLMHTGADAKKSQHNLLTTVAWQRDGHIRYALEGSVFMGGATVQWLRDGLQIINSAADVEALASSVPDNGGVYFVPSFVGLGAPYWDPYARGIMVGLSRGVTKAHIARAAVEAIALQNLDIMESMQADSGLPITAIRADGGASRNNMLMQLQANLLGVPVERPMLTETTALGAACLAGLATDFWKDKSDMTARWKLDRLFEPRMSEDERLSHRHNWHKAVSRAKDWLKD